MNKKIEPIKSFEEFNEVWEYIVKNTVARLGISKRQAELRMKAIKQSGILTNLGHPDEPLFKIGIDIAMRIPQLGEKE